MVTTWCIGGAAWLTGGDGFAIDGLFDIGVGEEKERNGNRAGDEPERDHRR